MQGSQAESFISIRMADNHGKAKSLDDIITASMSESVIIPMDLLNMVDRSINVTDKDQT
jgi:hypothetical protein